MNTMMNLNENELAAVAGGFDGNLYEATNGIGPVTPGIPANDIEPKSDPIIVGPEIGIPVDPTILNRPQITTGIRLWDFI